MVDAPTTRPVVTGFTQRTAQGLFSAPWLASPSDEGMATPLQLSDFLTQGPARSDDPSRALGHLLAAQGHCREAARARETRLCLGHYGQALKACERALDGLESSHGPASSALADWARGVHTLIRAQMAMTTDPAAARTTAYEALHQLSPIADPLCAGAQADALSAMLLVREPSELESALTALPDEVRALLDEVEGEVQRKEAELNHALLAVRQSHRQGVAWSAGWGLLNLILMATGPINSLYGSSVPWSLPFLIALPLLWYVT